MTGETAYIGNYALWYKFFELPFGAKQEETFSNEYHDKKAKPKNSATRYLLACDILNFRKKIKEGK